MNVPLGKNLLRHVRNGFQEWQTDRYLTKRMSGHRVVGNDYFEFDDFKARIVGFVQSMQTDDSGVRYRYSIDCTQPVLYASAYACMTLSLLGEVQRLGDSRKRAWDEYFDSFQNEHDGLFYDPAVSNDLFADSDWWGSRHLALHMISAYTDIGSRPKYPFSFLRKYYNTHNIRSWLDQFDWSGQSIGRDDVDNKIMNIGCLLQYQRDNWDDPDAANAVDYLKKYLRGKINQETGMWGGFDPENSDERSRMVQFAYHIFALFFYDHEFDFKQEIILGHVLRTQNKFGGFGARYNSSACEDIDSIDILIRLYPFASQQLKAAIDRSLDKALTWVLTNQVIDDGFVFRLNEKLKYGHHQMTSGANVGAMFPTWFRVLSVTYLRQKRDNRFVINRAPGLIF